MKPDAHLSRSDSVEAKADAEELSDLVAKLIAELPQRQREVLVLATYESLSNQQIAESLGIKVSNVHANLSTARKKLKEWLARDGRM